jgi:uncharacterized protein
MNQDILNSKLLRACSEGDLEDAKHLIASGADVKIKNIFGWTPLIVASYRGHIETAKLLIEAGADVNATEKQEQTALMLSSSKKGNTEIVKTLIEAGADVNAKDKYSKTALDYAIKYDHKEIADLIKGEIK